MASDHHIDRLRGERRADASGRFSLDRELAREKLEKFQLPDPHRYVLELVRAAHALGASRVAFDIDSDEMEMLCDGTLTLDASGLEYIYDALFHHETDPHAEASRHLATALVAAGALKPSHIVVESAPLDEPGASLTIRGDDEIVDVYEPDDDRRWYTTRVYLRERPSPQHLLEFFRNLSGDLAEKKLLRHHCAHASLDITLCGTSISEGLELPTIEADITERIPAKIARRVSGAESAPPDDGEPYDCTVPIDLHVEDPGAETKTAQNAYRGVLGLRLQRNSWRPCRLIVYKRGVWVDTLTFRDFVSWDAVLDFPHAALDLSRASLQQRALRRMYRDAIEPVLYEALLTCLRARLGDRDEMRARLREQPLPVHRHHALTSIAQTILTRYHDPPPGYYEKPYRDLRPDPYYEMIDWCCAFPMWPTADDSPPCWPDPSTPSHRLTSMLALTGRRPSLSDTPFPLSVMRFRDLQTDEGPVLLDDDRNFNSFGWPDRIFEGEGITKDLDEEPPSMAEFLRTHVGLEARDVTEELQTAQIRTRNRARWLQSEPWSPPPSAGWPTGIVVSTPRVRRVDLELGNMRTQALEGGATIHYIKGTRLLATHAEPDFPFAMRIAIVGDLRADEFFEDIAIDRDHVEDIFLPIIEALPGLFVRAASSAPQQLGPPLFRLFVAKLLSGDLLDDCLELFRVPVSQLPEVLRPWRRRLLSARSEDLWGLARKSAGPRERARLSEALERLGAISDLELFTSVLGDRISLRDIAADLDEYGSVLVASATIEIDGRSRPTADYYREAQIDRLVVHPDDEGALESFFSEAHIEPFGQQLAERTRRERFLQRPTEPVELPGDAYIHRRDWSLEAPGDETQLRARGVVGMCEAFEELLESDGGHEALRVTFYRQRRPLGARRYSSEFGRFDAVVDGAFPATRDWDDLGSGELVRDTMTRLRGVVLQAFTEWLHSLQEDPGDVSDAGWLFAVERIGALHGALPSLGEVEIFVEEGEERALSLREVLRRTDDDPVHVRIAGRPVPDDLPTELPILVFPDHRLSEEIARSVFDRVRIVLEPRESSVEASTERLEDAPPAQTREEPAEDTPSASRREEPAPARDSQGTSPRSSRSEPPPSEHGLDRVDAAASESEDAADADTEPPVAEPEELEEPPPRPADEGRGRGRREGPDIPASTAPRERLEIRLRSLLRTLRSAHPDGLSAAFVESVSVVDASDRTPHPSVGDDPTRLGAAHPLVAHAMARPDDDVALRVLASCVTTHAASSTTAAWILHERLTTGALESS